MSYPTRTVFIGKYIYATDSTGGWDSNVMKIVSYPELEVFKNTKNIMPNTLLS